MKPALIYILSFITIFFIADKVYAQKKLVIMGSSTAAGNGASSYANSWAGKIQAYYQQNLSDGLDTTVINIALSGYNSYLEMPTGYPHPSNRPDPDPNANVTRALSYSPDVVIINLPSNDVVAGYTKKEYMDNMRVMFAMINAFGARCFITTTQPRNVSNEQRDSLHTLIDSINNNFSIRTINFWDDLVSPLTDPTNIYTINPPVSAGDGVHVNDLGHNYLFLRVRDKQIFSATANGPLPLLLTDFQASLAGNTVLLKWHTEQEDPNTFFEIQRSSDGINFQTIAQLMATGLSQGNYYSWTDMNPLDTKNFYRLKIVEPSQARFSKTVIVVQKAKELNINRLYKDNSSSVLFADISIHRSQAAVIRLVNMAGVIVYQESEYIASPSKTVQVPISKLATGQYFINIRTPDNNYISGSFIKE